MLFSFDKLDSKPKRIAIVAEAMRRELAQRLSRTIAGGLSVGATPEAIAEDCVKVYEGAADLTLQLLELAARLPVGEQDVRIDVIDVAEMLDEMERDIERAVDATFEKIVAEAGCNRNACERQFHARGEVHVCHEAPGHSGPHRCDCGASVAQGSRAEVRPDA